MISVYPKDLPPSKSLYNRALILKSFFPDLVISSEGEELGEDVTALSQALQDFQSDKFEFEIGAGAGPLRFFAVRLSRERGSFLIRGTERLFSRPHDELVSLLRTLGCDSIELGKDSMRFQSSGLWPKHLSFSLETSSQHLSALLLSSWDLEESLEVELQSANASWSYAEMTFQLLQQMGWQGELKKQENSTRILLPRKQKLVMDELFVEPDMSCQAFVALLSVLRDGVRFWGFPVDSLQGDQVIFEILEKMGVRLISSPLEFPPGYKNLRVEKSRSYKGIEWNLASTPDLFPVLAVFCAGAKTPSKLCSLSHLNKKESRRLDRITELFRMVGAKGERRGDDFFIEPVSDLIDKAQDFDPDQDHRLAMAAVLFNELGANLRITDPHVVNKSFPNFWNFIS